MRNLEDIITFTKFERIHFGANTSNKKILKRALELELVIETIIGKRRFFEVVDESELLLLYPEMMVDVKTKEKYSDLINNIPSKKDRIKKLNNILLRKKWDKNITKEIKDA